MSNPGTSALESFNEMNEPIGQRSDSHGFNDIYDATGVGSEPGVSGNAAVLVRSNSDVLGFRRPIVFTGNATIAFRIKFNSAPASDQWIFGGNGGIVVDSFGRFRIDGPLGVGGQRVWTPGFVQSVWYHIVLTTDGVNVELLVDGVSQGTNSHLSIYITVIGSRVFSGGVFLNASIDDFLHYTRTLTQPEALFLSSNPGYAALGGSPKLPEPETAVNINDIESHYKLDEESGIRVDSVGGNDASEFNSVGFSSGLIGNAADLIRSNNEGFSISPTQMNGKSLSFWIKPKVHPRNHFLTSHQFVLTSEMFFSTLDTMTARITPENRALLPFLIYQSQWWHLAIVFGATSISTYCNGQLYSQNPTFTQNYILEYLFIRNTISSGLNGLVDEVSLAKSELTQENVSWLYNKFNARNLSEYAGQASAPALHGAILNSRILNSTMIAGAS